MTSRPLSAVRAHRFGSPLSSVTSASRILRLMLKNPSGLPLALDAIADRQPCGLASRTVADLAHWQPPSDGRVNCVPHCLAQRLRGTLAYSGPGIKCENLTTSVGFSFVIFRIFGGVEV
jgi:hypothetical protein